MAVAGLDANQWCFWNLTNILECYCRYQYNGIPSIYYTYDDESNEQIHGLTNDRDFMNMLRGY
jgi:hypothetical protein